MCLMENNCRIYEPPVSEVVDVKTDGLVWQDVSEP